MYMLMKYTDTFFIKLRSTLKIVRAIKNNKICDLDQISNLARQMETTHGIVVLSPSIFVKTLHTPSKSRRVFSGYFFFSLVF